MQLALRPRSLQGRILKGTFLYYNGNEEAVRRVVAAQMGEPAAVAANVKPLGPSPAEPAS